MDRRDMVKALAVLAALLLAVLVIALGIPALSAHGARGLHPCVTEDAPGPCRWDASTQGNGMGESFWVDAEQRVHYSD